MGFKTGVKVLISFPHHTYLLLFTKCWPRENIGVRKWEKWQVVCSLEMCSGISTSCNAPSGPSMQNDQIMSWVLGRRNTYCNLTSKEDITPIPDLHCPHIIWLEKLYILTEIIWLEQLSVPIGSRVCQWRILNRMDFTTLMDYTTIQCKSPSPYHLASWNKDI